MRPTCRFRFHVNQDQERLLYCPKCGSPTHLVEVPFAELKSEENINAPGPQVEVLLDNIRSAFNVGSMFRTADGAGINHIHLCGITPTPDHPKLAKTALGAENNVPWTQHWDAKAALEKAKLDGFRIWALEAGERSESLFGCLADLQESQPIFLAVGNEVSGIDPGLLDLCDKIIRIPMLGIKKSLNVSIAFGIAVYYLRFPPLSS